MVISKSKLMSYAGTALFIGLAAFGTPSFANASTTTDTVTTTDQIMVVYEAGQAPMSTMSVDSSSSLGTTTEGQVVKIAPVADGQTVEEALAEAEAQPGVAYAEPDYILAAATLETTSAEGSSDSVFAAQTSLNDPYASKEYYLNTIDAYKAWNDSRVNNAVTVAVIDTGVNFNLADFSGNIDKSRAYDSANSRLLTDANNDKIGHGTAVASVIAARVNNGIGMAGVGYNATVLPIKAADSTGAMHLSAIIRGIDYVIGLNDPSIKVINMSLGSPNADEENGRSLLHEAVKRAYNAGIVVVAAAGNGEQSPVNAYYVPSDYDEVISVMAVDESNKAISSYDHNNYKDISAPGAMILSLSTTGDVCYYSGTSLAAPLTSASAALVAAKYPTLTNKEIVNSLQAGAVDKGDSGKDKYYGYGVLNVANALVKAQGYASTAQVDAEIASLPETPENLNRIAGADRYETMRKTIATTFTKSSGVDTVVIASGEKPYDALAAAGYAGVINAPVLITSSSELSSSTKSTITDLATVKNVVLVGGTSAISSKVESTLENTMGLNVKRISGSDRQQTANKLASDVDGWSKVAIIVSGTGAADALSVAPYAYATNSAIFLADNSGALSKETLSLLDNGGFTKAMIVGGTSVVSSSTESALKSQFGKSSVSRVAGDNRFETSAELAAVALSEGVLSYKNSYVAAGDNDKNGMLPFADSLSASSVAGTKKSLVILVGSSSHGLEGVQAVSKATSSLGTPTILGGSAAITPTLAQKISESYFS